MIVLHYQQRDIFLQQGAYMLGRAPDCEIVLDDLLASRRHLRLVVEGERASVHDLGSANGSWLNGNRLEGGAALMSGDVLRVGSTEIVVRSCTSDFPRAKDGETIDQRAMRATVMPAAGEIDAAPVTGGRSPDELCVAADVALREGRTADAEGFAKALLSALVQAAQGGRLPDASILESAGLLAMKLATLSKKAEWFDEAVELYSGTAQVMPTAVVNEAHAAVRSIPKVDIPRLRTYVASLRARTGDLSPSYRFLVNRLEGLVGVVAR